MRRPRAAGYDAESAQPPLSSTALCALTVVSALGGKSRREKGSSLNSACLTPKPPASSVYVHVLEAHSPLKRSILVTSPFPYPNS
jgi:hypothetical protein